MSYCDVFVFLHNAYRVRTFFCTCLWVMETWARRQPQGTDWPLLRLLYPCFLPRTSPRRCLLIQCAAAKLATRGGQFRLTLWFLAFLFLFCFFHWFLMNLWELQGDLCRVGEGVAAAAEPLVGASLPGAVHLQTDGNATCRWSRPASRERQGGHEGAGGQVWPRPEILPLFLRSFFQGLSGVCLATRGPC